MQLNAQRKRNRVESMTLDCIEAQRQLNLLASMTPDRTCWRLRGRERGPRQPQQPDSFSYTYKVFPYWAQVHISEMGPQQCVRTVSISLPPFLRAAFFLTSITTIPHYSPLPVSNLKRTSVLLRSWDPAPSWGPSGVSSPVGCLTAVGIYRIYPEIQHRPETRRVLVVPSGTLFGPGGPPAAGCSCCFCCCMWHMHIC